MEWGGQSPRLGIASGHHVPQCAMLSVLSVSCGLICGLVVVTVVFVVQSLPRRDLRVDA